MAEKIVNGIGREIRYVEYKLRKKTGTGKAGKKKNKHAPNPLGDLQSRHHATEYTDDGGGSGSVSVDMLQALPKDRTEESIQMQVALAMSKEESQDERKKAESDKIRLELAIKESLDKSKAQQQQQQQQHSSDFPVYGQLNKPSTTAINDPWGGNTTNQQQQQSLFNNTPVSNDPWGAPAIVTPTTAPAPQPQPQDMWGMPSLASPNSYQTTPVSQDPWSATSSQMPTAPPQSDQWSGQAKPTPSAFPVNAIQTDAWGAPAPVQTNTFSNSDAFATSSQSTDLFGASTVMPPPAQFDPLHDFDNLRVSSTATTVGGEAMAPIVLSSDVTSNVAFDILPLTETSNTNTVENNTSVATTKSSSVIDGTQGLVNLDNLLAGPYSTNPYYNINMKSLSGSANAFTPRTIQPSMNQLRGGSGATTQAPFSLRNTPHPAFAASNAQAFTLPNPTVLAPTMQPNALYPSLQMQPQMPGMYNVGQPTNPMFPQQNAAMFPVNQSNNLFLQ